MKKTILILFCVLLPLATVAKEEIALPAPVDQATVVQPPQVTHVQFLGLRPNPKDGGVVIAFFDAGYYVTEDGEQVWKKVKRFNVTWQAADWQAKLTAPERTAVRAFLDALKTDAEAKVAAALVSP